MKICRITIPFADSVDAVIKKPVAVIAAKQRDRIIVITQYRDKAGNDIMVPVIIGKNLNANGNVWISANIAATAYGKQSVKEMLAAAIEKEKSGEIAIFGANKKIASKLPYSGLQLSSGGGFNTVHNITDDNSPVKLDIEKNTKSLQFKRWFGDSIVVDEKGESLVVYQLSVGDVLYKLVTSEKGDFRSFYSNKKATNEVTEPNGSSASSKSPYNNIYQFSENASAEEFRFSIADFSEEQQRNIMDILSPFVGDVVERDREEYADYLASRGVKNVSPDDAFHFALEIVRRKHLTALAARRAKRDNWLYDNILEYKLDSSISTMSATAFSDVEKAQPVSVNTLLK